MREEKDISNNEYEKPRCVEKKIRSLMMGDAGYLVRTQ